MSLFKSGDLAKSALALGIDPAFQPCLNCHKFKRAMEGFRYLCN